MNIIVGKTNSQNINLARISMKMSPVEPFLIDEFFYIEDYMNNNPICRVIESSQCSLDSCGFKDEILSRGLDANDIEFVYIAICRIEKEIFYPINKKSVVRNPSFDEVKELFYTCDIKKGLPIGEIRGTEKLYDTIQSGWNNAVCMRKDDKIKTQTCAPFVFDIRKMEQFPHIGLFGGSGSGKTFALKCIIEELIKKHIPMIILDPHYEMSFDKNIDEIPDNLKFDFSPYVETFIIGENVGINFSKIDSAALVDIMKFSGEISPPMEAAVYAIHKPGETYCEFENKFEEICSAFEMAESERNSKTKSPNPIYDKYSKRVSGLSTLTAISWRINELKRRGVFEGDVEGIKRALMKQKACVVRGPLQLLNIVGSYIANSMYENRRKFVDSQTMTIGAERFVPFILIMDEAHSFAPNNSAIKSPMNTILETISKEGRKYGVFEILATQRPKLLNHTISAQLSSKFVFRTVDKSDIDTIRGETDLDSNSLSRLPFMDAGSCFVSSAISGKCISVKIRSNISTAKISVSPFDELEPIPDFDEKFLNAVLKNLPIAKRDIFEKQTEIEKAVGERYSLDKFIEKLDYLVESGKITKKGRGIVIEYIKNT